MYLGFLSMASYNSVNKCIARLVGLGRYWCEYIQGFNKVNRLATREQLENGGYNGGE